MKRHLQEVPFYVIALMEVHDHRCNRGHEKHLDKWIE